MYKIATVLLLLFVTLTSSVHAEEVGVMDIDTVAVDTLQTCTPDSIAATDSVPKKRVPWYVRAYRFADRVLSPPRDPDYIDVQDYYNWCGELQLTTRFEIYEMDASNEFSMRVSPDMRWRIGPFFGWRFAFLGYNFDLKSLFFSNDDTDLSASVYSAAFGIDLFYRRVGGNYNIRSLSIDGVDLSESFRGRPFDGISQGMTRVSFYYVTNYKRYSHQAAFNQTHRQIRSAGSPIVGFQYARNTLSVDVGELADVLGEGNVGDVDLHNLLQNQKNYEFSITGGYGYSWVFAKNFLAAAELTGALGYLYQRTKIESRAKENDSFLKKIDGFYRKNIAFNANFRLALLYNNGPWFAGAQAVGFYYQYGNGTVMSRNLLGCTYLFVGFNF